MLTKYFDECEIGETGVTRGRTVTEADIVAFASLSGDWHSLHVDQEYAAQSRFGQRVAHGMLVLSVATGLLDLLSPYAVAFYGMTSVEFRRPTFIGDTLRVKWDLAEKQARSDGSGLVTWALLVVKADDEVCARATMTMLVADSPLGDAELGHLVERT